MKKALFRCGVALCGPIALACAMQSPASSATPPFGMLRYRSIGPAIAGGRAPAIAGSDADPQVYYAGGAGGGVFKSDDGGASWRPVFDAQSVAPIGAIAVSPRSSNDVWVGTGEANPRNTVEEGNGLYHSIDGGKTWRHVGLDDAGSISTISIDPRNPDVIAVGVLGHIFRDSTMRGVYVSRDGGRNFTRTLYAGPSTGASDIARVPDRPSTMFAGMYQVRRKAFTMLSGGPQGGIFRSDDNGATWRKLHGNGLPEGSVGRVGVAAATHGRVYAIIQSRGGDVWRSDDGGATWKVMPHDPYVGARPFYFSHLFVDPANRDRVISVGLILSMSTDGARKFHVIAKNGGWDYHDIWWSKDGRRIAIASDEGVLFSRDGGERAWQPYDLPFAQPYHIGFNHGVPSYAICIGLQDDSSWCGPSNPANGIGTINRSWYQTVYSGDGMWSVFDPKDPSLVWSTSTNSDTGEVFLTSLRTRQQFEVSPDAEINGERAADSLKYRFNWDTPIAFASDGSALVGGNVVFKSSDRGQTWSVISPDLTRNERSKQGAPGGAISVDESGAEIYNTILDIEPARDAVGQIWVSSDDGLVHLTRDDGASWQNVTPAGLPEGRIDTVEPGHGSPGTAYIALQRHMSGDDRPYVYLTDDFGAHWSSIASNLPRNLFVRSIREDPTSRNLLYVGTQRGIFISFDRGRSWQPFRLNMPATAIYDLQIQPEMNDLVVASHGRGVWILDDLSPVQQLEKARGTQVTLFPIQAAYRMSQNPPVHTFTDPALPDNEFIGESRPYGALIDYYLAKAAKSVEIDVVDAQGRAVRRLRGKSIPKTEGIDRTSWDLLEDGPVKWNGTYALNRGPDEGPEAVPGSYTVRLIVDGVTQEQPLVVTADPRDTSGPQQAVARRQFLETLMSELSGVDTMLNAIDDRLKVAGEPERSALLALRERLTYDPQNVEDLRGPAQLRERILDLLSRVGAQSFQGPNAPEAAEAANVQTAYQAVESAFKQL